MYTGLETFALGSSRLDPLFGVLDIAFCVFQRAWPLYFMTSFCLFRKFVTPSFFSHAGKGAFVQKLLFFYFYNVIVVGGTPPLWHQPAGSSGFRVKLNFKLNPSETAV